MATVPSGCRDELPPLGIERHLVCGMEPELREPALADEPDMDARELDDPAVALRSRHDQSHDVFVRPDPCAAFSPGRRVLLGHVVSLPALRLSLPGDQLAVPRPGSADALDAELS